MPFSPHCYKKCYINKAKTKTKQNKKKVTNDLKLCINSVTSFCVLHWKKHVTVYKDIHLVKLIKKGLSVNHGIKLSEE